MIKTSRYLLVCLFICVAAAVLPEIYHTAFAKRVHKPFIMYSAVQKLFFMHKKGTNETMYYDEHGNFYTRSAYEQNLPLFHFRQLLTEGIMPDSIQGIAVDAHLLAGENFYFRLLPANLNQIKSPLFPLFEAESGRASLEFPDDYFRINLNGIEFIRARDNVVLQEKSEAFTLEMMAHGFNFPSKMIEGKPTVRKTVDEGYFIVDDEDQLFHLKMERGKPYVAQIPLPDGFRIAHMECVDYRNHEFYAFIISEKNELYTLETDTYFLRKWPIENYDRFKDILQISGSILYRVVNVQNSDKVFAVVCDRDYNKLDYYEERVENPEGAVTAFLDQFLFPFQLEANASSRGYFRLRPVFEWNWLLLAGNLLFTGLAFFIIQRKGTPLRQRAVDMLLVCIFGLLGFVAIFIVPPLPLFYKGRRGQ